jgi:hypothetical protein
MSRASEKCASDMMRRDQAVSEIVRHLEGVRTDAIRARIDTASIDRTYCPIDKKSWTDV